MSDPFVHLRVASGYSFQHGASHPSALVATAAEHGQSVMALTDRDGLYGAIRFAKACLQHGVAPVLGVDLAVPEPVAALSRAPRRTAARGGETRDRRHPRVVPLATSRTGWASLCRLVSATHLAGERGTPETSLDQLERHGDDLVVMLGSDSSFGLRVAERDRLGAEAELQRWVDRLGADRVVIAATNHQVAGSGVNSAAQAGGMVALADRFSLPAVLTNQVRMAERHQAATVDVLDAARRLVPLDLRNIDRRNAEGYLKSGKAMVEIAEHVAQLAGRGRHGAERLVADTRTLGLRCQLDPRADLGLGEIHLPEFGVLGTTAEEVMTTLRQRCEAGIAGRYGSSSALVEKVERRLDEELAVIEHLGFASYFLTVADVVQLVRDMGIRCAARGSGAGSMVNHLLGISGVDPIANGLIMERFLSPLRRALPDIDLDVESARRTEIYEKILDVFGGERVACVAMLETYRVRHAVRDVGAALSLPPIEVDAIAKAFPHIRARDARSALRDLPELRAAGLAERRLDVLFDLVESLDGLPRHVALHPCGVLLSDATLGDRTPVEASFGGFPMSQFDKDDVEDIGLLKLDVLGIRMQSSMAHCLDEIERTGHVRPDIDALAPFDDPDTYDLIAHAATLGCFQIESPGQRELIGKFGPTTFTDVVIDISLFRPGPVKSDMVVPFLNARQGWKDPVYLHPDLVPVLEETGGVVVFHEQIIQIVAVMTGCSLAQADEVRRALGDPAGQADVRAWFIPTTIDRGYDERVVEKVWSVLAAFASFGFCKAHAAAFALPTYQSAWLKRHHPAHFIAGVLTHDPGMYPKRLILEEARRMQVPVLGLDVNASSDVYRVECLHGLEWGDWRPSRRTDLDEEQEQAGLEPGSDPATAVRPLNPQGLPQDPEHGIRMALNEVKGISAIEVARIVAGQPYHSLTDFWNRAQVDAPVVERLVLAGAFDRLYGIGRAAAVHQRGLLTRRDLVLAVADLRRLQVVEARTASRAKGLRRTKPVASNLDDPRDLARSQAQGEVVNARRADAFAGVQLALDFTDPGEDEARSEGWGSSRQGPGDVAATGLPELDDRQRLELELEILGMDASQHVMAFYRAFLQRLGTTWSPDLLGQRSHADLLVAGVKVATQTPPVRSGRRVVFLTLDDGSGPVDATFFEDAQGPYAATVFSSWLLVVRGELRRTGPRGVSLRATGAWDLQALFATYQAHLTRDGDVDAAMQAVVDEINARPEQLQAPAPRAERMTDARPAADAQTHGRAGGMGPRRVLVHASGFKQSPYADVKPAGTPAAQAPRKLWHSSPGSSGW
ncbi:DNA polymerase III subunit alpha [Aestuariimicrobium sp. T2.26MG-19.2B]|uniref:DNA polymerase III subunit alpha n=1 Tax=Aestuariimicrobium sp. T2.26MG-19.2B TaxID=3040679 RepID=UPI0024772E68|nr:DNA polymerase III subunit alpha [Aestuariimicrobium sp. T2.26MG-19.2B]CAI9399518.1 Error-prone DNA polymerase [Aestuariimicrobium sp. T2.26MG-19.2B]